MSLCPHIINASSTSTSTSTKNNTKIGGSSSIILCPPGPFSKVYKDECTLCTNSTINGDSIATCLTCFNGSCWDSFSPMSSTHAMWHMKKTNHPVLLIDDKELFCLMCVESIMLEIPPINDKKMFYEANSILPCQLLDVIWGIRDAQTAQKKVQLLQQKANDFANNLSTIPQCPHSLDISQSNSIGMENNIISCNSCLEATATATTAAAADSNTIDNLWLCLSCGNLGCARSQWDGSGGKGHGLQHFKDTKHPLSIKVGTISESKEEADINCYICDSLVQISNLPSLLDGLSSLFSPSSSTFLALNAPKGSTMAELQLEMLNMSKSLKDSDPLTEIPFKKGIRGIKNIGNFCYISSVLQSLIHLTTLVDPSHQEKCTIDPPSCFPCQYSKISNAIYSSSPFSPIDPWMFKDILTKFGNRQFSNDLQQDAGEFLSLLLEEMIPLTLGRQHQKPFLIMEESILECEACLHKAKSPLTTSSTLNVSLYDAGESGLMSLQGTLDQYFSPQPLPGWKCPSCSHCQSDNFPSKRIVLREAPKFLIIILSRFGVREVEGDGEGGGTSFEAQKIDCSLQVPMEGLYIGDWIKSSNTDDKCYDEISSSTFVVEKPSKQYKQTPSPFIEMGFTQEHYEQAINFLGPKSNDQELVLNYLMETPYQDPSILKDAGFSDSLIREALNATSSDIMAALEYCLLHNSPNDDGVDGITTNDNSNSDKDNNSCHYKLDSFISHKGKSLNCGHYINHCFINGDWVMFNDSKAFQQSDEEVKESANHDAYIYVYKRI